MTKYNVALGCGYFAIFFVSHGIGTLAIPYYQMTLGVDPLLLGLVLTIPVFVSALISPWVANVIDAIAPLKHSQRMLLIGSGWICAAAYAAMWAVPVHWSVDQSIAYLLACSLVFYFFATFMTVIMRCQAMEATSDTHGITSVMGFTSVFEKLGSILYFWLFPLAQSKLFSSLAVGMKTIGLWVAVLLIGVLSTLAGIWGKSRNVSAIASQVFSTEKSVPFNPQLLKQINLLFVVTVLQFGLIGACINVDFYLLVYFVEGGDIAQGAFWKGYLSTAYAVMGLITIPVIVKAGNRFGKKQTLFAIYLINCINAMFKWVLYQPDMDYWLVLDAVLGAWIWTAHTTLIPALLADVCYENQQKTGVLSDSFVVGRHNRFLNFGLVLSFVLSGWMLNVIGFNADTPGAQPSGVIYAMQAILVGGSLLVSVCAMAVLSRFTFQRSNSTALR
ncbi:MFS transporter [Alteromonas sp. AMM-1]|uniref:MFS transporter n=1 Tax=Alteromonas sp. AMM-1 TaxID=3394233 RepID=UPI0039A74D23